MPFSFIISRVFPFKFSNALLFLIEVSVIVFVISWEVSFDVSVTGSNTFL